MKLTLLRGLAAIMLALTLSACASEKTLPNGDLLAMRTVNDSLDRSASLTGQYRRDPATGQMVQIAADLTVGPTMIGQTIVNTVPVAVGGLINRNTALAVADKQRCAGPDPANPNYIGCGNTIIGGATANAVTVATSKVNNKTTVRTGGCSTCGLIKP